MGLNQKQREQLLKPINPARVQQAQGQSHIAGYDVAAHLTRIFGFGNWEKHITSLTLVCEDGIEKGGRTGWNVTYKCEMTLVVKDPSGTPIWSGDDAATGSASNLPSKGDAHDFAVKNAVTYALKRCAKDWGDQFGLSLYNKGSLRALIGATLDQAADETDVEKDLPELHPDADQQDGSEAQDARAQQELAAVPDEDDGDNGDWLDDISSQAAADKRSEALRKAFQAGAMGPTKAGRIRAAIQQRAKELAEQAGPRTGRPDLEAAAVAALAERAAKAETVGDLRKVHDDARAARKLTASFMHEGHAVTLGAFISHRKTTLESANGHQMAGAR